MRKKDAKLLKLPPLGAILIKTVENFSTPEMAEIKIGTAVERRDLSPVLSIFRLIPEPGSRFPEYTAGQYIALRRDNCRLTKRILHPDGRVTYHQETDEYGNPKRGPVTHSYTISSAPRETTREGYLEFYIILETHSDGNPGRLTESLFQIEPDGDNKVTYFAKIAGDFTLDKRAAGFENVVMVGTGTGLAPFASMMKEMHLRALDGSQTKTRFTLIHGNRGKKELGYHESFLEIQEAQNIDFRYVPTVSRPSKKDLLDSTLGKGRANNVLRSVLDLPLKEEELVRQVREEGTEGSGLEASLARAVEPVLPGHLSKQELLSRMIPGKTVLLTCGNPRVMADIESIAQRRNIRFEKEEW